MQDDLYNIWMCFLLSLMLISFESFLLLNLIYDRYKSWLCLHIIYWMEFLLPYVKIKEQLLWYHIFFPQDSDTDKIMFQGYKCIGMWVGKRLNFNRRCEVLLTNDPRNSTPQSPVEKGAGLGSGIEDRFVRLKILPD